MVVLPKGTLVKVGGMPFRLLADVETDGLEENYRLAMEPLGTGSGLCGALTLEGIGDRVQALESIVHTNLSADKGSLLPRESVSSMPSRHD